MDNDFDDGWVHSLCDNREVGCIGIDSFVSYLTGISFVILLAVYCVFYFCSFRDVVVYACRLPLVDE